jgi:hypothetical protein
VAQGLPHGDLGRARVLRHVVRHVLGQRLIERQDAGIDELQERIGEHGLGQRCGLEDGLSIDRRLARHIAHTRRRHIDDLALVDDRHGDAGHVAIRHQLLEAGGKA